jgi:hypothetical protein
MGFSQRWRDWLSALLSTASTKKITEWETGQQNLPRPRDEARRPALAHAVRPCNGGSQRAHWVCGPTRISQSPAHQSFRLSGLSVRRRPVVFLSPVQGDVAVIKKVLRIFGGASGLFTNMDKCVATPIRCSQEQTDLF